MGFRDCGLLKASLPSKDWDKEGSEYLGLFCGEMVVLPRLYTAEQERNSCTTCISYFIWQDQTIHISLSPFYPKFFYSQSILQHTTCFILQPLQAIKADSTRMQTFQSVNIKFVKQNFRMAFEWKGEVAQDQEVLGNRSSFQSHFRGVSCLCWTWEQNFNSMQVLFDLVHMSSWPQLLSKTQAAVLCYTACLRALGGTCGVLRGAVLLKGYTRQSISWHASSEVVFQSTAVCVPLSTILFAAYTYMLLRFFSYYKLHFIGQLEKVVSALPLCLSARIWDCLVPIYNFYGHSQCLSKRCRHIPPLQFILTTFWILVTAKQIAILFLFTRLTTNTQRDGYW